MIPWRLFPFVRPCIALLAGILFCEFLRLPIGILVLLLAGAILVITLNDFVYTRSVRYPMLAGYLIVFIYFGLGFCSHLIHQFVNQHQTAVAQIKPGGVYTIIGVIEEYPNPMKNLKTTLNISWLCRGDSCTSANMKMLVSFGHLKTDVVSFSPGDKVRLQCKINKIAFNSNPSAFDYGLYMARQGVFHQIYPEPDVILLARNQLGFPKQWTISLRNRCLSVLDKYMKGDERAVAKAMILGYRQEVERELYQTFSTSGAMHILAVSGMHLAIIANILLGLVKRFNAQKDQTGIFAFVVILIILWFFSLMTGSESAIVRSALMFSFILYGKTNKHHHSTYNVMAFCAVIMLVFQSQQLFNAGFLFSFLALLSLIFFQPVIEKWWLPPDRFSSWIWQHVAASMAAQILVAPLTLFLFHQFPLYFMLSGFVPVWISALALKCGLLVFSLEFILPQLNQWVVPLLNFLFHFFIQSVQWIESLPYAAVGPFFMGIPEFILFHLGLIALMLFVRLRKFNALMLVLVCFTLAFGVVVFNKIQNYHQVYITFYDSKKQALADVFIGTQCIAFGDSVALSSQAPFVFQNHRAKSGIENVQYVWPDHPPLSWGEGRFSWKWFQWRNYYFEWLHKDGHPQQDMPVSLYIVTTDLWPPKDDLPFKAPVVLDASVRGKRLEQWKRYLAKQHLIYYAVTESGALVIHEPFRFPNDEK